MNIKRIRTRQFAGLKNKEINLDKGLNIIVGNNESGKSTMVELAYQLFYQSTNINARTDKDFLSRFFPANSKADTIYGEMSYETEKGEYLLEKRWGKKDAQSLCELTDPEDTIITNADTVEEEISAILTYKRGLYDDVVFASQKRQADVVEHILKSVENKAKKEEASAKEDLVSILTNEGTDLINGPAPDEIEKLLKAQIEKYVGHWDFDRNLPEGNRGVDNPWKVGKGVIVDAYYDFAEYDRKLKAIQIAEEAIEKDSADLEKKKEACNELKAKRNAMDVYLPALASRDVALNLKKELEISIAELEKDKKAYPDFLSAYGKALNLKKKAKYKAIADAYNDYKKARNNFFTAQKALEKEVEISNEEILDALTNERKIENLKAKLSNMDLSGLIEKYSDQDIKIVSVLSGEELNVVDGRFDITETVKISVPEIFSITIAPADIDIEKTNSEIEEYGEKLKAILNKYDVEDIDSLKAKKAGYEDAYREFEASRDDYLEICDLSDEDTSITLAEKIWEKLEKDYKSLPDETEYINVEAEIVELCGTSNVDVFISKQQTAFETIENRYKKDGTASSEKDTIDAIEALLKDKTENLNKQIEIIKNAEDIPEEYLSITNPEEYMKWLKLNIEEMEESIDITKKHLEEDKEIRGTASYEDLLALEGEAKNKFEKYKSDCAHYKNILKVFLEEKDNFSSGSGIEDVRMRFADYLSIITDGKISLDSMDENMDMEINSSGNRLNYSILSEGTKDTIALAFRLAMLSHLFPEGGGLVVLDDPFTDMDEKRTIQACKLVQKFADDGNQVIFVTCDNKYTKLLSGNVVNM